VSNIQNQATGRRRTMLICLFILILSISAVLARKPARSEQESKQPSGTAEKTVKYVKYCEGKYRNKKDGSEKVLSIQCPSLDTDCECNQTHLKCGAKIKKGELLSITPLDFVEGSCKTTIVPDK